MSTQSIVNQVFVIFRLKLCKISENIDLNVDLHRLIFFKLFASLLNESDFECTGTHTDMRSSVFRRNKDYSVELSNKCHSEILKCSKTVAVYKLVRATINIETLDVEVTIYPNIYRLICCDSGDGTVDICFSLNFLLIFPNFSSDSKQVQVFPIGKFGNVIDVRSSIMRTP